MKGVLKGRMRGGRGGVREREEKSGGGYGVVDVEMGVGNIPIILLSTLSILILKLNSVNFSINDLNPSLKRSSIDTQ
jgi:hypothetical protein